MRTITIEFDIPEEHAEAYRAVHPELVFEDFFITHNPHDECPFSFRVVSDSEPPEEEVFRRKNEKI